MASSARDPGGAPPSPADGRDDGGPGLAEAPGLATSQVDEMVAAWRRGDRPLAEEFLARHPGLGDEAAIRLIYEETCLRLEAGMAVDPAEIAARFPRWKEELESLLDCQLRMHADAGPSFPAAGDILAGFHLLVELGRGVMGRVFLASQPSLADRPVVLKVALCGREEHLSLARLQHMNIVPLYSEHVLQARGLRILCMPFLGGATLLQILEDLDVPLPERSGKLLLAALDRIQARLPVALPGEGPFRDHLTRSGYEAAICSIVASLADALQYAHDRDLVHMDVKPSNVLIAADGQPMLLDFHLARAPIRPGPAPASMGGTPGYTSPEQQLAVECVRGRRPITCEVDGRADIYSLGVLLYEALGGPRGTAGSPRPPLRSSNPRASIGLSDIVQKCLSPNASARYRDAASLAMDLRRHLADLPLLGVPNRSPAERWRKWRRRRPVALLRSLAVLGLGGTAIGLGAALWGGYSRRVDAVESALSEGLSQLKRRQHEGAVAALERGLKLGDRLPGVERQRRALREGLLAARRSEKAAELHRLAELLRLRYGLGQPPSGEADWLLPRARSLWGARHILARTTEGQGGSEIERQIKEDMHEFVVVWADLRVRLATPAEIQEARRESLALLDEAEGLFGPSPSLDRRRQEYAAGANDRRPRPAASRPPSTAWEHYDLGSLYLREGNLELASEQFEAGLDLSPQDFWLNFSQGICAYRLRRFQEATLSFHTCCALSPQTAECYFNLALAYQALGDASRAIKNYERALRLNATLTDAALNLGILHYKENRLGEAASVLERALASAGSPSQLGEIHYTMALIDLSRSDRAGARAHLKAAEGHGHAAARTLAERLDNGQ